MSSFWCPPAGGSTAGAIAAAGGIRGDPGRLLAWQKEGRLFIKPTCAPQYYRLWREDAAARGEAITGRATAWRP